MGNMAEAVAEGRAAAKPSLIAFCGDIGAGKDTVADYLVRSHGFVTASFATPLKNTVLGVYHSLGMESRHVFGTQEDKAEAIPGLLTPEGEPMTGRHALEKVGTEGFRAACPDTWILLATHQIRAAIAAGFRVAVTDARFPNEFDVVRELGGKLVRVTKLGTRAERTGHASDEAWRALQFDGIVAAEAGDLSALYADADRLLAEL